MFQLHEETPTHYIIKHPKGDVLKIAKSGLSEQTHSSIKKLAEGGQVPTTEESIKKDLAKPTAPEPPKNPDDQNNKWVSQGIRGRYADGGEVEGQKQSPVVINIGGGAPNPTPSPQPTVGDQVSAAQAGNPIVTTPQTEPTPPQTAPTAAPAPRQASGVPDRTKLPPLEQQLQAAQGNITSGANQQAQAEKQIAAQSAPVYQAQQQHLEQIGNMTTDNFNKISAEQMKIAHELQNGDVDFNRVWHNAGTGKKVLAAIGIALGGIGSGMTGGPNMALKVIDDEISKDIESQKAVMANKKTALGAYNDVMQNTTHAAQTLQSVYTAAVAAQISKITAGQGGPLAEAKKKLLLGEILPKLQMQTYQAAQERANWQYAMGGGNQPATPQQPGQAITQQGAAAGNGQPDAGKVGTVNLDKMNALQFAKIMDKEDAASATKEAKEFQEGQTTKANLKKDLDLIVDSIKKNRFIEGQFEKSAGPINFKNGLLHPEFNISPLTARQGQEMLGKLPFHFGEALSEGMEPWGGVIGKQYAAAKASAENKITSFLTKRIGGEATKNVKLQLPEAHDSDEEIRTKIERAMKVVDEHTATPTLDKWNLIR